MTDEQPKAALVYNIRTPSGKTWKEENAELPHRIPIGALVEIQDPEGGVVNDARARLWVVEHTRDCDMTPLYSLGTKTRQMQWEDAKQRGSEIAHVYAMGFEGGYTEDNLKIIEYPDGFLMPQGDGGSGC